MLNDYQLPDSLRTNQKKEIIATIGPTFETVDQFESAIACNCRWFRMPFGYRQRMHCVHASDVYLAAKNKNISIELLADLPSRRPRMHHNNDIFVEPGHQLTLTTNNTMDGLIVDGLADIICDLKVADKIMFHDGRIICQIMDIGDKFVNIIVTTGSGSIKEGNSLVFPNTECHFEIVQKEDIQLLATMIEEGHHATWVALSLISTPEDIFKAKERLSALKKAPRIMAKIETLSAVDNIDEIMPLVDAIMIARGDLGQVVPFSELPGIEKLLIEKALFWNKKVFVATQLLESFAENGIPHRAELIDVATVNWLNADGIMLGKETVYSKFPIESIALANDIFSRTTSFEMNWLSYAHQNTATNLIAIEGPDGVGKTTLCNALHDKLHLQLIRGIPVEWENDVLKKRMIETDNWIASALFFLSGVLENKNIISQEEMYISDRSIWSSLAIHVKKDPSRIPDICHILSLVAPYAIFPFVVIVLDAGYEYAKMRINKKRALDLELDKAAPQGIIPYEREIDFFRWLKKLGINIIFVNAKCSADEVFRKVKGIISRCLQL